MNYRSIYQAEVRQRLTPLTSIPDLTFEGLSLLPEPVKKYLVFVGAIGKPEIRNMKVVFNGSMKRSLKSSWMDINSEQYNFFDEPSRFFYIRSRMFGIPFDGLHIYRGSSATMQIKVASILQVADAYGEKMSHGETVTLLNDMCLMAPTTLVNKNIEWETLDELRAKVIYTNGNITVSAILTFNQEGALIDFISEDRYLCEDGKTYLSYPWSTPVSKYREVEGRRIPASADAIWHMPEGDFCYARFSLQEIGYNVTAL